MEVVSTESQLFDPATIFSDADGELHESPIIAVFDVDELSFELGVWLSGLESFVASGNNAFVDRGQVEAATRNWARECRLTRAALLLCSKLNFRLRKSVAQQGDGAAVQFSVRELDDFALLVRDAIVLNESILSQRELNFGEWRSWSSTLYGKLKSSPVHDKLARRVEERGDAFLPRRLKDLMSKPGIPFADEVDLKVILPQFGAILGLLSVVGRMLKNDEPLKPSLLIFSRVHEQTQDLISHMNNRLSRFPNEGAAMFDSLDGASYSASLELKKVFSHELLGLANVRPVPSVFSRVETAYELLSDSFRQILAGFARVMDPKINSAEIFPQFDSRLEQSLALRKNLWTVLKAVRRAEQNPEKKLLEAASEELRGLLENSLDYVFHKDRETIDRFAEEIFASTEKKDIVPILHRFGAYVETLLGQVNMRTVLADHPFDPAS
ncbi:MAG TPA: hypothetical protein VNA22_07515 [Pyrinomonadaceae bacterium]|nr:hypothetical protein [Pyrinomonadaceae bacterium]